ncbi:Subtilisin-related protease with thrombospondin repeats [Klebsormidium nitens]|uniref:Subtilisin-related protease with thrombospondin repeats n=1 Tax=Klebsormidium nitens TaxID=105231 RepID=A0A1Y1IAM7_KLENI|nr:Subtilisin-related protease with thrombospondin repeats [Klebsormidium nitens]|eukprot:GAQ87623.1 Subtilisin-related protease with thrombospondin repeats [Klebsormidium nitens]
MRTCPKLKTSTVAHLLLRKGEAEHLPQEADDLSSGEAYQKCSLGKGLPSFYTSNVDRGQKCDNGILTTTPQSLTDQRPFLVKLTNGTAADVVDQMCSGKYNGTCSFKYKATIHGMTVLMDQSTLKGFMYDYKEFIDHVEAVGTAWGIRATHKDFWYPDGRTNSSGWALNRIGNGVDLVADGQGTNDCHGHGTHCAGVVGGVWSGVAKEAILHPVRTMDCNGSGSYDAIIGGLDWIGQNYQLPGVVSMSLTTPASPTLDAAVASLVDLGLVVVAAAGNYHADACGYSPARSSAVISVQSSNNIDQQSSFSNYGSCTSIFAPGEVINSCGISSDISIVALSGTSMACPAVAGAAAVYLSQNPSARPADVSQAILDASLPSAISVTSDTASPKRLLNINMQTPYMTVSPRTIVQTENSTVTITISLSSAPRYNVVVQFGLGDSTVGLFVEQSRLTYFSPSDWRTNRTVVLQLLTSPDFLDHTTSMTFTFLSKDPNFNKVLSGQVTSQDTDVCRPCGGTLDYPKVIPRLPFYQEGSTHFSPTTITTASFSGSCGGAGPNMIYMLMPPWDMTVTAHVCNSQFDTVLTILKRTGKTSAGIQTVVQACNDDSCSIQSRVTNVALTKNTVYYFVINGYAKDNGLYGINVTSPTPPPSGQKWLAPKAVVAPPTTSSLTVAEAAVLAEAKGTVNILSVDSPAPSSPVMVDGKLFTKWNTMGSLPPASSGAPLAENPTANAPYWSVSPWTDCSAECGGGVQDRVVTCLATDGSPVSADNYCDVSVRPSERQPCNTQPCMTYSVYTGPWSECSVSCGGGSQDRSSHCQDQFGNTAAPEACGLSVDDLANRAGNTQACNTGPCGDYYFSPGPWSVCNAPCQWGHATRDVPCVQRASNATVDLGLCYGASLYGSPVEYFSSEKACNTQPCGAFSWMVGPWSACQSGNGTCHNGTQTRLVECLDSNGNTRTPATCSEQPAPANVTTCSTLSNYCDPYEGGSACSEHGTCDNTGTCTCQAGWGGPLCDLPTAGPCAGGRPDVRGACCLSGVLDVRGACCRNSTLAGAPMLLDGAGRCCASGSVDACGVCDGAGKFVDSTGACCETTRDESGVCCASGLLDECLVCDGDGTSCASAVTLTLTLTTPLDAAVNATVVSANLAVGVAAALGLAKRAVHVTDFVAVNTTEGAGQMSSPDPSAGKSRPLAEYVYVDLMVQPLGMSDSSVVGRSASVIAALDTALGGGNGPLALSQFGFPDGVMLESVDPVVRRGICGNGVCEIGERCTPLGTSASGPANDSSAVPQSPPQCCYKDCPYVAQACPLALTGPLSGQVCGARGRCLDATGTCDCFVGHTGTDCSLCVRGFVPTASGLCVNPESGKQNGTVAGLEGTPGSGPTGAPSGSGSGSGVAATAGTNSTKLIIGLVVGLAVVIVAAAAAAVIIRKKRTPRQGAPAAAATASVSPLTAPTASTSEASQVPTEKDAKKETGESAVGVGSQAETAEPTSPRSIPHLNGESTEIAPAQH